MPEAEVEDRSHVVVVTPDNHAAFVESKLNPQAEPVKEEKKEEAKVEEPKAEDKEAQGLDKKEGKLNKRFSELTEQRKAAEARAEAAERKAAELEAKLNPPKQKTEDGPKRDQFASDEEFQQALVDHRVDQKLREKEAKEAEAKQNEQREKTIKGFKSRQDAFVKETPDYAEKLEAAEVVVSNEVRDMIVESDFGPQILYHFANNPEEAERIRDMTAAGAARAFGKLEARFENEKAPQGASKSESEKPKEVSAPKVEISKAPAPITPLKGANAPADLPINGKGEWTGTYQEYKAAVEAGKIK